MSLDTQKSLITYLYNLFTTDTTLITRMGGAVRCYLAFAPPDAVFPYLVHRIDISSEPGAYPIQGAAYYLDIWSDSPDASEILAIRQQLITLLDQLVFSTDDVKRVHIESASNSFIPEIEQDIWHYATMWEFIFRRDAEAAAIEGR